MEEETSLKEELRLLHLLEMHMEVGLQDKVKGSLLLDNYKSELESANEDKKRITKLIIGVLEESLNEPEKAKVTLAQLKSSILEKRKEIAKAKMKGRIGR